MRRRAQSALRLPERRGSRNVRDSAPDHVAGGAFIVFGIVVFAISGDLPFGTLSAPGAGMMPKLMAGLMMVFALAVIAGGAVEPGACADRLERPRPRRVVVSDHGGRGRALPAARLSDHHDPAGILAARLVERRNVFSAAAYSVALTLFAYWLFGKALKSPLERGLLWF